MLAVVIGLVTQRPNMDDSHRNSRLGCRWRPSARHGSHPRPEVRHQYSARGAGTRHHPESRPPMTTDRRRRLYCRGISAETLSSLASQVRSGDIPTSEGPTGRPFRINVPGLAMFHTGQMHQL